MSSLSFLKGFKSLFFLALYSCDFHCLLVSIHFYVIFVQGVSVCVSAGTHRHIQSTTSGGGPCLAPHLRQAVLVVACTAGGGPARACAFSNPAFPLPEKCWDSRRALPHPACMWVVGFWYHACGRYFTHWAISSFQVSIHIYFSFSIFSFLFLVVFYFSCLPWYILCKRFALSDPFRSIPWSVRLLLKNSAWPSHHSYMT